MYLLASENGNGALAVLATEHTRKRFNPGIFGGDLGFWTEVYYKYRLVNLVTGKTIISSKENHFKYTIETAGDYFLANSDLYRFLDNGDVEHTVKNDQELAVRILKRYFEERGINAGVKTVAWEVQIDYN